MSDPWADVREHINHVHNEGWGWASNDTFGPNTERLLADADALLEVRQYAQHRIGCEIWAEGFRGLLKIAFAGKVIETIDHPVVRRLLGR